MHASYARSCTRLLTRPITRLVTRLVTRPVAAMLALGTPGMALGQALHAPHDGVCGVCRDRPELVPPVTLFDIEPPKDWLDVVERGAGQPTIQLHLVVDSTLAPVLGTDAVGFAERVFAITRETWVRDQAMGGAGIDLRLEGVTVLQSDTWSGLTDPFDVLGAFNSYAMTNLPIIADERDAVALLSGIDFAGSTIGLAFIGGICGPFSTSINQAAPADEARVAGILAHELGHNMSALHDSDGNACPITGFIMSPILGPVPPEDFSVCSHAYFNTALAEPAIAACLAAPAPPDCPADINGDGVLTGADFNAFLTAFSAMDPAADQNNDGVFTGADFNAFLTNFSAGCN